MAVERIRPGYKVQRFTGQPFRFVDVSETRQNLCMHIVRDEGCVEIVATCRFAREPDPGLGLVVAALFVDRVCELCRSSCEDWDVLIVLQCCATRSQRHLGKVRETGEHLYSGA